MKKISFCVPVLLAIVFTACKSSDKEQEAVPNPANTPVSTAPVTNTTTQPQQPATSISAPTVVTQPNNVATQPNNVTPVNIQAPVTTKNAVAAGLNPAHGEPGHRCDIPVGSPLNSAPAKPAAAVSANPTVQPIVTTPTVVNTTPAAKVAPGMNPAHGEPGHRCDIPVGSPLSTPKAVTPPGVSIAPTTQSVKQ